MSFLSILEGKKAKPEEIAREIVELESQLPSFEASIAIAEKSAIKLRQKKLGGGNFDVKEMDKTAATLDDVNLNMKALKLSISELQEKLVIAIESQKKSEENSIKDEQEKFNKLKKENRDEVVKLAARLHALTIEWKQDIPKYNTTVPADSIAGFIRINISTPDQASFVDEFDKQFFKLGSKSGLGIKDLSNELSAKINSLERYDLNTEVERLLNKARIAAGVENV